MKVGYSKVVLRWDGEDVGDGDELRIPQPVHRMGSQDREAVVPPDLHVWVYPYEPEGRSMALQIAMHKAGQIRDRLPDDEGDRVVVSIYDHSGEIELVTGEAPPFRPPSRAYEPDRSRSNGAA